MKEEKKDKIVESLLFIMAAIGGILVVTTALIFAFNMNLLFGLFILGVALVMTSLTISELYRKRLKKASNEYRRHQKL